MNAQAHPRVIVTGGIGTVVVTRVLANEDAVVTTVVGFITGQPLNVDGGKFHALRATTARDPATRRNHHDR